MQVEFHWLQLTGKMPVLQKTVGWASSLPIYKTPLFSLNYERQT